MLNSANFLSVFSLLWGTHKGNASTVVGGTGTKDGAPWWEKVSRYNRYANDFNDLCENKSDGFSLGEASSTSDITLTQILLLGFSGVITDNNKDADLFAVEIFIDKNQGDKTRKYWQELQKRDSIYWVGHRQCTSCVNWSLAGVSGAGALVRKPVTFLKKLAKNAKSTSGDFKGQKPNIGIIHYGTGWWEEQLESGSLKKELIDAQNQSN